MGMIKGQFNITKYAALLLSRQSLQPSGEEGWVKNLSAAIEYLKDKHYGLISSVAIPTWGMVTALASAEKLPLKLFLIAIDQQEFEILIEQTVSEFNLDQSLVEFLPCWKTKDKQSATNDFPSRDLTVVKAADLLLPISIRTNGIMNSLVAEADTGGKDVDRQFETIYSKRTEPLGYSVDKNRLNLKLKPLGSDYLIHWTRASSSAWPDEKLIDYYSAIANSTVYPRAAFETLKHILQSGKIIASCRHMPNRIETVSFSEATPLEIIDLIRWRARYRMMSFEPYAVGIKKEVANKLGIRPVSYYDRAEKNSEPTTEAWLTQSQGGVTDWRQEKEQRCLGDFDLRKIPRDKMLLFCRRPEEAVQLVDEFKIKAISFLP